MTTVTQWFNIAENGQPRKPGWWDAKYSGESECSSRFWWDGEVWRIEPNGTDTAFGNSADHHAGDCYRGLVDKP